MPNFKVANEEKLQAVLEYLNENTSQKAVAKKYGVSLASFQTWVRKYEAEGEIGLKPSVTYKKYSMYYLRKFDIFKEIKTAIEEYIYYYNNNRYQEKLGCLSPMEYHNLMAA